jgi:tripartite-type tricarboxylate transporter receptor subunit TctC
MTKIFLLVITSLISFSSLANEVKVPGVWGFAVGSTQGNYFRAILNQANKEQSKFAFRFEHKPGAGGAIASKFVLDQSPKVAILAHSAAFFVRPNLYPDTPYNFDQFKPIMIMGFAPATLVTKQKSLDQLLKQSRITLATAGAGSSTHLIAETFAKGLKQKEITMVHFKDTNEASLAVMGGHVDATFEFLGDAKAKATPDTMLLGLTGKVKHEGIPVLKDLGFKDMEHLSGIFAIYVNKSMPEEMAKELQAILLKAEKHEVVQRLYKNDYTSKESFMQVPSDLTNWYNSTVNQYKSLTSGIKIN